MFSHTKRHYCKFFDYWKYSLKDGTYLRKKIRMKNRGEQVPTVTKEFSLANERMIDQILKEIHY